MDQRQFPCKQCGADLKFEPGVDALKCPYCGTENSIPKSDEWIEELDFSAYLARAHSQQEMVEVMTVKCSGCGAEMTLEPNVTSGECAYCGASLVKTTASRRLIKPQALLPFKVAEKEARQAFKDWLKGLWFAPSKLKQYARGEKICGIYVPHWTYDTEAETKYVGRRGEYYWETETYATVEDGETVTKTRQVQRTRWYPASGRVTNSFDDLLVLATESLPRKYTAKLEPWDLNALVPYQDEYLSGFRSQSYSIDLQGGFEIARKIMEPTIERTIRQDIGGDEQQILNKQTYYRDITFKHILLPVWLSAYRYGDTVYRFLVNARTGEVQGERPWSWVKITLAVLLAGIIIGVIVYFASQN